MFHYSGRNSFGFQHDWLKTYHRLHFLQKVFFVYTLNVRKLAQRFHSLSRRNSKIGPRRRKYASVQFWAGWLRLDSHSKALAYAHTITLKYRENSWNSLFHNCPNMVLSISFLTWSFSARSIDHLATVWSISNQSWPAWHQHASLTSLTLSMPFSTFSRHNQSVVGPSCYGLTFLRY